MYSPAWRKQGADDFVDFHCCSSIAESIYADAMVGNAPGLVKSPIVAAAEFV